MALCTPIAGLRSAFHSTQDTSMRTARAEGFCALLLVWLDPVPKSTVPLILHMAVISTGTGKLLIRKRGVP